MTKIHVLQQENRGERDFLLKNIANGKDSEDYKISMETTGKKVKQKTVVCACANLMPPGKK